MIKLNDKYYIDADKCNMILKIKSIAIKGKNAGKEVFKDAYFYNNIEQLLNRLFEKRMFDLVKDNNYEDIKEALVDIKKLKEEFLKEIENIKIK